MWWGYAEIRDRKCFSVQFKHFMIATGLGRVLILGLLVLFGIMAWTQIAGNAPTSAVVWPLVILALLTALIASLHVKIQVEEDLRVRLWPFPARVISFPEITSVAVTQYRPIRDYGGWGLKLGRGGVAYTVSGNLGVKVELANGRHIMIGAKQPAAVCAAIQEKISG